ncbi:hypothetical protein H6F96_28030 [Microcoleus sp. FACHB-53]|jgi:hypothetical protein|nr:hypothetical protein [Microcoleus sp. FACHB-53]MBD2130736.1 hypothetical protein [Microcoleus sp. FACHB-1]
MLYIFFQHLGLSTAELETLLSLSLQESLTLPAVQELLGSLDTQLLQATLPTAGSVLAERLPPFYDWLKNELGVKRVPDSPDHTTKWVIGFLHHKESLTRLVELHRRVPRPALERSIPRLVAAFDGVEQEKVRKEWQKAIAALCLVLVVAARAEERSLQAVM